MMRNQIQRQKQLLTHKTMSVGTKQPALNRQNPPPYSEHRSICFIQLTDYSENRSRDENPCFRTTFFSKLGKRISPKKSFFKTMMNRFQQCPSSDKIKLRKTQKSEEKHPSMAMESSERSNFIIKKINETAKIKENQSGNRPKSRKDYNCKTEGKQTNLIEDIQRLRYSENGYLKMLKDKSILSNTNIINLSLEDQQSCGNLINAQSTGQIRPSQTMQAKEEACLRLRQKIKNKQSRKHIYHSLKSKCDAWNKIRLKTQQHFNRQRTSLLAVEECQSNRLHCKQISHHPKNIQGIVIKQKFKPLFDSSNPLKIISKPCMISVNSFINSETVQSSIRSMYLSSQGNPQSPELSSNRFKPKKDVYQEILSNLSREKKDSTLGRCRTGEKGQQRNQFRLLTPWKAENDDAL